MDKIIDDELWRSVGCESFAEFVYKALSVNREVMEYWLRNTPAMLYKFNSALNGDDVAQLELERNTKPLPFKGKAKGTGSSKNGNSAEYIASRLARDYPDLYSAVQRGELSLNQAAIKAGFRKRAHTLPYDPVDAVATLAKRYSTDEFEALRQAINNARRQA